ncbi:DUF58 domain-containing protein [Jeotgalibacillus salarius]|uniref:DUF58 domain-containing protein n=1 Tax=Jeotgalibacillus salarius TaxID=546023 RepID=A0A4Y8LCK6_9BACL|nr:DUF58 domain-containing protein [Jeotgalibacillus salarius]TFE00334.1 DUF58 domain-containing protein [Jeotgalibacillus salarius]
MWLEVKSANRNINALGVISFLSGLFFFLGSQFAVSAACVLILIYIKLHLHYSEYAGSDLKFLQEDPPERLNVNDDSIWTIVFQNGRYPIRNVDLTLTFTDQADFLNEPSSKVGHTIQWTGSLSMDRYEEVQINIPFKAVRRGKLKMVSCQLIVPHLFGHGYKILQYKGHFKQEKRIYPEIERVKFSTVSPSQLPGGELAPYSLYEDLTMPSGTREYRSGDTMQRINWSAYAKTGQLQTNIYEPVIEEKSMVILNVAYGHSKNIHFENLIKQAAFMITEAHRNNRVIGLCVNIRTKESPNFYYIAPDRGISHSRKCLEILSILSIGDVTLPVNAMINQISLMQVRVTDTIYIGSLQPSVNLTLLKGRVWVVSENGGGAVRWNQQTGIQ